MKTKELKLHLCATRYLIEFHLISLNPSLFARIIYGKSSGSLFTPGEGNVVLSSIRILKYSNANSSMHIARFSVENKTFCRISVPDDFQTARPTEHPSCTTEKEEVLTPKMCTVDGANNDLRLSSFQFSGKCIGDGIKQNPFGFAELSPCCTRLKRARGFLNSRHESLNRHPFSIWEHYPSYWVKLAPPIHLLLFVGVAPRIPPGPPLIV